MRQLQLVAFGEPSDVIELHTVSEPVLGQEDVLVSMEAAPINPSDFLLVRGIYGVRPSFPFSMGTEGVGRVTHTGSKVDVALQGKRVLILPTLEQGTWADQVVVPVRTLVPMSDEADPLQLSMIGINPVTAYLLLNRYVSLMPGDWIGQTAANSAMGQYIIALAKLAGVKTLNVVRREEAAQQVWQSGGDRVVYGIQSEQFPVFSLDFVFRGLSLHGFWLANWIRHAPRTEIQEVYQKLGDLVADGSLSAAVEQVYPLDQFKEAFEHSLRSNRRGKILFTFGA
jgi:NADPH:quinone reductase-like Zn-dependent oxidoreductase